MPLQGQAEHPYDGCAGCHVLAWLSTGFQVSLQSPVCVYFNSNLVFKFLRAGKSLSPGPTSMVGHCTLI